MGQIIIALIAVLVATVGIYLGVAANRDYPPFTASTPTPTPTPTLPPTLTPPPLTTREATLTPTSPPLATR